MVRCIVECKGIYKNFDIGEKCMYKCPRCSGRIKDSERKCPTCHGQISDEQYEQLCLARPYESKNSI